MKDQTLERALEEKWDLVIKPKTKLLDLKFSEIWHYRELMMLFVRRDFIAQYKQTILGPLWHVIQPVLTTVMFLLIFTRVARLPTDGVPPVLFYMSGITLWNYFSVSLTSTSNTFLTHASIFGKVYFPRIIIPMSIIISNLVRLGIQFLLLMSTILYFYFFEDYDLQLTINWLMIPLLFGLLAGIALGLGIIISSITTKYRDVTMLLSFGVHLWMYATPIAYPLSRIKDLGIAWIAKVNPIAPVAEAFRYALFSKGTFTTSDLLYSLCFMLAVLAVGIISFNKIEKSFADTV